MDITDPIGLRDRAILEVLYSTGIRRLEVVKLKLIGVDLDGRRVFIFEGKGKKDRMIPIGERAVLWVRKYLAEARPRLAREADEGLVFLTNVDEFLAANYLTELAQKYVGKSGIGKPGSCHLFRHTIATLMLEGGADVRYVQAMLGHSQLSTTEIYTHVSIRKLKEVHDHTHPAKNHAPYQAPANPYSLSEGIQTHGRARAGGGAGQTRGCNRHLARVWLPGGRRRSGRC